MEKLTITEDFSQSYNELKSDLKEKYSNMLYSYVDQAREKALQMSSDIISDDVLRLSEQTKKLKKQLNAETKAFYQSKEYTAVQQRLTSLNEQLKSCQESEREELQKQISKAMAEVVTLNITIKNRLKNERETIKINEDLIKSKIKDFDKDIERVSENVMDFLRDKIAICIKYYNDELNELNQTFNLPSSTTNELPFDSNGIKLEFPIFSLLSIDDNEDADSPSEHKDEGRTIIASDNFDTTKN